MVTLCLLVFDGDKADIVCHVIMLFQQDQVARFNSDHDSSLKKKRKYGELSRLLQ